MALFRDIPKFTQCSGYCVDVGMDYLPLHYAGHVTEYGLDVNPAFQRGYVWTPEQKVRYVEYMLRGGMSGRDLYFNAPNWNRGDLGLDSTDPNSWYVLVDGKQRLDAALGFLNNEFPVFGNYYREFTDRIRGVVSGFRWHVNDLPTMEAVYQWYLELNAGGTVHTEAELDKVRVMLASQLPYVKPPSSELIASAHLDREVLVKAVKSRAEEEARQHENLRKLEAAEAAKPKRRGGRG